MDHITVIEGRLKPASTAQNLRLGTRQAHRLVLSYSEDAPAGLTSRQRGQPSNRQLSPSLDNRSISLIRRNNSDFGPNLAQENWSSAAALSWPRKRFDGLWSMPAYGYRGVLPRYQGQVNSR